MEIYFFKGIVFPKFYKKLNNSLQYILHYWNN